MMRRVILGLAGVACLGLGTNAFSQSAGEASQLFRGGHWREAVSAFAAVEQAQPGKTDALLYEGKALLNLGQFQKAGVALQEYLSGHQKSDDALYLLAYARFRENQPAESLQLYADAAKIKPPAADDLKIVALDYVLLKDYTSAGRTLEAALQLDPGNLEARYHLGRVRYQQNRFDEAIAAFRNVLNRDPNNVKAEDNLGLSLEGKGQADDAILAYRRAIRLDRALLLRSERPYLDLSILFNKLNRATESVTLLEEAVQIAPQSEQAHRELAKAYFAGQRLEDARGEAEHAIQIDPGDSSAHYLLGRIYHRLGKADLAAQHFHITEQLIREEQSKTGGMGVPEERN